MLRGIRMQCSHSACLSNVDFVLNAACYAGVVCISNVNRSEHNIHAHGFITGGSAEYTGESNWLCEYADRKPGRNRRVELREGCAAYQV